MRFDRSLYIFLYHAGAYCRGEVINQQVSNGDPLQEQTIEVLGGAPILGRFYNPATNEIISSQSFWNDIGEDQVITVANNDFNFRTKQSDSFDETSKLFDLSVEAKLDLLGGIGSIEGKFDMVKKSRSTRRVQRAVAEMNYLTEYKEINTETFNNPVYLDALSSYGDTPLYVITGIQYGSSVTLDCMYEMEESESSQDIRGSLKIVMDAIPISGQADAEIDETQKNIRSSLTCEFKGNVEKPDEAPTTFQKAKELYQNSLSLLAAVPIKMKLKPADQILDSQTKELCRMSDENSEHIFQLYDEMSSIRAQAQDNINDAKQYVSTSNGYINRLSFFQEYVDEILGNFTIVMGKLPALRQNCKPLPLSDLNRPSLASVEKWLIQIEAEITYMRNFIEGLTAYGALPDVFNSMADNDETNVIVIRTPKLEDDSYLERLVDGVDMTGANVGDFIQFKSSYYLDTFDILNTYGMGGQLGYAVDPTTRILTSSDTEPGYDLLSFDKETRRDPTFDVASRVLLICSVYNKFNSDDNFTKTRRDFWFTKKDDGSREFDTYEIIDARDNRDICALNPTGDVVDGLMTGYCEECCGESFSDMSEWGKVEVVELGIHPEPALGGWNHRVASIKAMSRTDQVLLRTGKYTRTPYIPSRIYQVGENEQFTGYLLVARNITECGSCKGAVPGVQGGWLHPTLFIPIKEALTTTSPTFSPTILSPDTSDSSDNIRSCFFISVAISTILGALMM